jgi:riboflavin synthase
MNETIMFTGIIEHLGTVAQLAPIAGGARLELEPIDLGTPLRRGESVAVNGVCLTSLPNDRGVFIADLSNETLSVTSLGGLSSGSRVNLERALSLGAHLGGHIVQGHVDAVGRLVDVKREGEFAVFRWSFPAEFGDFIISKGSIAVDGVSLTVVDPDDTSFSAALIPETLLRTNLGGSRVGDPVNLEFDMMAKYAVKILGPYRPNRD